MSIQLKNKKYYFFAVVFITTTFFLAYNFYYQENKKLEEIVIIEKEQSLSKKISSAQVCFEESCFEVEIADTTEKQQAGLMNRENLERNQGMLFIFDIEDKHKFWMKNTLIPLDMIWIDKNNKIIFIQKNAQPCKTEQCESFGPDENAKYVLEINGGLAEEMGIEIGEEIRILGK